MAPSSPVLHHTNAASSSTAHPYETLPSYFSNGSAPSSPYASGSKAILSPPLNGGPSSRAGLFRRLVLARPRSLIALILMGATVLVLVQPANRRAAQGALDKAGVQLPDRLREFLDVWDFGSSETIGPGYGADDLEWAPTVPDGESLYAGFNENNKGNGKGPSGAALAADADFVASSPHTFHDNGHLIVKPVDQYKGGAPAPHPIMTLIQRAEALWARKLQRQSRSLEDCAKEYRRRYRRNPPRGFDKWWEYAKANRVILTDEYDQIHHDLEPFWALEPSDFVHRSKVMSQREESFTLMFKDGRISIEGPEGHLRRAKDLGDLMSRFAHFVPDVNLTFTRHDQPAVALDWTHKERMYELASQGEYFGPSDWVAGGDPRLSNWANECPDNSPLRKVELEARREIESNKKVHWKSDLQAYKTPESRERSYIFDHTKSMDLCQHPEIMPLHGFTMASGTDPGPLVPLFTFAKTNVHADVLVTPLEQYSDTYIGYDPPWEKKPINKLMWRGSTTGVDFDELNDWRNSQRARLHFLSHEQQGERNVLVAEADKAMQERKLPLKDMNAKYMDTSFSGGPVQCDDATCDYMRQAVDFRPTMGLDESYQYKYVMDVDGNGWSGRFHRLMSMKACVLKSTLFPEWYGDRVQPWVHYVPVKIDYSDLYDIMSFFRGTPDGKNAHEELASKIGMNGKRWARDHWRKQDMAAYMFRLALEWARLLHRVDDDATDYWE